MKKKLILVLSLIILLLLISPGAKAETTNNYVYWDVKDSLQRYIWDKNSINITNKVTEIKFGTFYEGDSSSSAYVYDVSKNKDQSVIIRLVSKSSDEMVMYIEYDGILKLEGSASSLFAELYKLKNIDFNRIDTSDVTSMGSMFHNCHSLENLDLSLFNTSKVTTMVSMFRYCYNLTNLNISSFNTSNVTNMSCIFDDCYHLKSLDLLNFDTSKVVEMMSMFYNCEDLQILDLSNFNTSNVQNMSLIFSGMSNLKTIYVSSLWRMDNVTEATNMFAECINLVGMNGTKYLEDSILFAKIDELNSKGYFSVKCSWTYNNESISNNVLFLKEGSFDIDDFNCVNCDCIKNNNEIYIRYKGLTIRRIALVFWNSNKYDLNNNYVFLENETDMSKIVEDIIINDATISVENDKLHIVYSDIYGSLSKDYDLIYVKNSDNNAIELNDYYKKTSFEEHIKLNTNTENYQLVLNNNSSGEYISNEDTVSVFFGDSLVSTYNIIINIPINSISLENDFSIEIGKTKELDAIIDPTNTTDDIFWTSSDNNVVTVDFTGKIKAVGIGTATITATTANGKGDTCIITVVSKTAVSYTTHVQDIGWQKYVSNGEMAGTSGKSLRLEAIRIKLENQEYEGNIEYRTHIQYMGWENGFKKNDEMSGTSGKSLRLEAIEIKLTGEMAEHYDVYYRVHAQEFGWLGWAKNGEDAGSAGYGYRLEGIEIKLISKDEEFAEYGKQDAFRGKIMYTTHVQDIGWQKYVMDGQRAGTTGKSLRLEAIRIKSNVSCYKGSVEYRTHIQNIGWESKFRKNDELSGTSGKSLRLEAIEIRLTEELEEHYDIYYRVHAQEFGWLNWAKNGEPSGTAGFGYRLEGIEIVMVNKGSPAPVRTNTNNQKAFIQK